MKYKAKHFSFEADNEHTPIWSSVETLPDLEL